MTTPIDLTGSQLGAYRLISMIGRGGTAEVYKAYHPALDRQVAVKILAREVSRDPEWIRRIRREARLLGRLDHPHILPIYDAGEYDGRPYLVMKFVEGGLTLQSLMEGTPWPITRAIRVLTQIAEALQAAHDTGVVHRDVKPSNILVTPELNCLVFDFGIAKPLRRRDVVTGEGLILGTPEYMSPEQCKGELVDHRSDIYALGIVTYEMLTGRVPFKGDTPVGTLMKHLTDPVPGREEGSPLPPAVHRVLTRALSRSPAERFPSARDFSRALAIAAGETPTYTIQAREIARQAREIARAIPFWRRWGRHPYLRWRPSLLAFALGVTGAILMGLLLARPDREQALQDQLQVPVEAAVAGEGQGPAAGPTLASNPPPATAPSPAPPPAEPSRKAKRRGEPARDLQPGTIEIRSNLPAQVAIDGRPVGTAGGSSPGIFEQVRPGRHRVELDAGQGGTRVFKEVLVTSGSTAHLSHEFQAGVESRAGFQAEAVMATPSLGETVNRTALGVPGRWEGFLTDEKCGEKGGLADHWACAQKCIKEGKQPLLYSGGKLYPIKGVDRLPVDAKGPLVVRGWLDPKTNSITVSDVERE